MLHDKICLITGALGGLGKTLTRSLHDAGATVIAVDNVDAEIDYGPSYHKANLLDEPGVATLFANVIAAHKRVDAVVNLVGGIYPWSTVDQIDFAVWQKTLALNLTPTFLCSREGIRQMKKQNNGAIINMGAQAGLKGAASAGPYGAAKAAVINLTQTLADEGKPFNIRVNAIVPSTIDTPANRKSMPTADFSKWVTAAEIANAIIFLLSDQAGGVTGAILPVPGRV